MIYLVAICDHFDSVFMCDSGHITTITLKYKVNMAGIEFSKHLLQLFYHQLLTQLDLQQNAFWFLTQIFHNHLNIMRLRRVKLWPSKTQSSEVTVDGHEWPWDLNLPSLKGFIISSWSIPPPTEHPSRITPSTFSFTTSTTLTFFKHFTFNYGISRL